MGLAEWWHYRKAPKVATPSPLVLDLAAGTFGGVMVGDAPDRVVAQLGAPASYQVAAKGVWSYPRWGLYVEVKDGRVDAIAAVSDGANDFEFDGSIRALFAPYPGAFVLEQGGPEVRTFAEADVRRLFGEPEMEDVDEDDGELCLAFEDLHRTRMFYFARDGVLRHAEVGGL